MSLLAGTLVVNMKQFAERWKRDPDTDRLHQKIAISKGIFYTIDTRPYEDILTEHGVFYSVR